MNPKVKEIKKEKEKLVEKALDKDQKLFNLAYEVILDQLEREGCPESDEGWFCPEMMETEGRLIDERVPLILEVLYEEGYLERKVSMGVPHYRMKR